MVSLQTHTSVLEKQGSDLYRSVDGFTGADVSSSRKSYVRLYSTLLKLLPSICLAGKN